MGDGCGPQTAAQPPGLAAIRGDAINGEPAPGYGDAQLNAVLARAGGLPRGQSPGVEPTAPIKRATAGRALSGRRPVGAGEGDHHRDADADAARTGDSDQGALVCRSDKGGEPRWWLEVTGKGGKVRLVPA